MRFRGFHFGTPPELFLAFAANSGGYIVLHRGDLKMSERNLHFSAWNPVKIRAFRDGLNCSLAGGRASF